MNRLIKEITIFSIIAMTLILIISRNNRYLKSPNPEELSSIILIDVIGEEGTQKITINQQVDINNFLDIFKNAKMTNKQSISQIPRKTKFTTVLYKFKSSGNKSFRSIYEENGDLYIDQPFVGVFKIDSNDLSILEQIIRRGNKKEISVLVNDILKSDF
ncbi:DUF5301 domain-containing protein [Tissierella sp. MB52-C2]|uniref:DUF5301 domain-containing protein n=1 Tax=Tissierella sp. MB52-C2 TaxID=3070999 RepID=UPI00280BEC23|nr:DUF5301 domain-containing protein [Tissierella sp. MB52-C2]WMM23328.1 DUF5301 domain-containing protein [Tissierella sp. MB52-C2]